MPATLTESDSFDSVITVPAGGDDRAAASVVVALQSLANRTKALKATLDGVTGDARDGIVRLREAADVTALQAITGMSTGDLALVPSLGLFRYDSASAVSAVGSIVVTPGVGSGRWVWQGYSLLDAAHGLPKLDASAYVPLAHLGQAPLFAAQKLVQDISETNAAIDTISSETWVDSATLVKSITVPGPCVLDISATVSVLTSALASGQLRLATSDGGGAGFANSRTYFGGIDGTAYRQTVTMRTLVNRAGAGTETIAVQGKADDSGHAFSVIGAATLSIVAHRIGAGVV